MGQFIQFIGSNIQQFLQFTAFANLTFGHLIMIAIGLVFIYLAIAKEFEPMLLVPIGFGILVGNVAFVPGFKIGVYEAGSVMNYLYFGVIQGLYPPLIFLGIGAMTDF
jgi:oxaloacetate decarboxylase beta subunit